MITPLGIFTIACIVLFLTDALFNYHRYTLSMKVSSAFVNVAIALLIMWAFIQLRQ